MNLSEKNILTHTNRLASKISWHLIFLFISGMKNSFSSLPWLSLDFNAWKKVLTVCEREYCCCKFSKYHTHWWRHLFPNRFHGYQWKRSKQYTKTSRYLIVTVSVKQLHIHFFFGWWRQHVPFSNSVWNCCRHKTGKCAKKWTWEHKIFLEAFFSKVVIFDRRIVFSHCQARKKRRARACAKQLKMIIVVSWVRAWIIADMHPSRSVAVWQESIH